MTFVPLSIVRRIAPDLRRARWITFGGAVAFWLVVALAAIGLLRGTVLANESRLRQASAADSARELNDYLDERLRALHFVASAPLAVRRPPLDAETLSVFAKEYREFSRVRFVEKRPSAGAHRPLYLAAPLPEGGFVVGVLRRDWTVRVASIRDCFGQDATGRRTVLVSRPGGRTPTSAPPPSWARLQEIAHDRPSVQTWGDGAAYLTAVAAVGSGLPDSRPPFIVVAATPMALVKARVARGRATLLLIGLGLGIVTGLVGCAVLGWAMRRMREANEALERRVAERTAELHEAEGSFRGIFEHVPLGLYQCDPQGRFLRANPMLAETLGFESPEALISGLGSLQALGDWEHRARFLERLEAEGEVREAAVAVTRADGRTVWLAERARAVRGPDGEIRVIEGAMHDVTAERELESRLRRIGETDPLTGLLNRRGLDGAIAASAVPVSFVTLDVDRFKAYNDAFGHLAGDHALRAVAEALHGNVRESDAVARAGGEEFVVVLPRTGAAGARRVAETLRAAVEACVGLERSLTMSVGVATATTVDEIPEALSAADRALYVAKEAGRNRVVANPATMA